MFKLTLKLLTLTLLLTAGAFFVSGSRASALTDNCSGAPYSDWGYTNGAGSLPSAMSSLTVRAVDTSQGNAPVNTNYILNSAFPGNSDPTLNARIFQWIPGSGPANRQQSATFSTGEHLKGTGGSEPTSCNGWSELGPGISGYAGNGYVLDCGAAGGEGNVKFWISHVDNPGGAQGKWALYNTTGGIHVPITTDLNNTGAAFFTESNGNNISLRLEWTPTNWTPTGYSTVDGQSTNGQSNPVQVKPGTTHRFNHWITNSGDPASYTWSVLGTGGNLPSGSANNVPNGGTNPTAGQTQNWFTAPNNVGGVYCQHIHYTNASGPNTGPGDSTAACIKVVNNPNPQCTNNCTPPPNTATCTAINWYNYGNFTTVNDAGKTIQHVTRTLVETSNPGAINNDNGGAIYAYAPGKDGSTDKSNQVWNITATSASFTVYTTREYQQTNGNWAYIDDSGNASSTPSRDAHDVSNCYHASCYSGGMQAIDGQGPGGAIIAGQQFRLLVPVTNDNGDANAQPIPSSVGGFNFSLTEPPESSPPGYQTAGYPNSFTEHDTGFGLDVGEPETATIYETAPSDVQSLNLSFYPDLFGSGSIGNGCSISIPIYQQFGGSVAAISTPVNSEGDAPTGYNYSTTVNISGTSHTVNIPTSSSFCIKYASGGQTCPNSNTGGTYTPPSQTAFSGSYTLPPNSLNAGDEYCATIDSAYTAGWVGPDSNVIGGNSPGHSADCPRVTNEPYFKVTNSSIATGGDFDSCTSTPGVLAGFNNNQDRGYDRGASAQLSVLGLLSTGISGVASGQTVGTIGSGGQGAMGLTFANGAGAPYGGDTDKPTLGGNAGTCQQLTNKSPDKPTSAITSSTAAPTDVSGLASGEYTAGDLYIGSRPLPAPGATTTTTETMTANHQVEIFATGNVYIGSNIKYDNTGAVPGTVPSLVIHAAGNIYIDPAVANLAGTFIAQKTTSGGTIYTCGTSSFTALSTGGSPNIYNDCHNQLLVYGSFVANQVNLMRTFGSLRDETPVGGTSPVAPGQDTPGASQSLVWSSTGQPPNSKSCVSITPPNAGAALASSWSSANLCLSASETQPVTLGTSSASGANCTGDWGNWLRLNSRAYRQFDAWRTRNLCSNYAISLSKTNDPNLYCTQITNTTSPNNTNGWPSPYVCIAQYVAGTPGSSGTAPSFPSPLSCSNAPGANPQVTATGPTCAAEVFRFSPEIYLSNPGGACTVNCGGGSTPPPQSITSLPPVL